MPLHLLPRHPSSTTLRPNLSQRIPPHQHGQHNHQPTNPVPNLTTRTLLPRSLPHAALRPARNRRRHLGLRKENHTPVRLPLRAIPSKNLVVFSRCRRSNTARLPRHIHHLAAPRTIRTSLHLRLLGLIHGRLDLLGFRPQTFELRCC